MTASSGTTPATSPQSLANFGCENCRQQHLKCDRVTPSCGRCSAAGRECVRTGLKIRVAKKTFTKKQKWVKTPKRLVFIDETRTVTSDLRSQDTGNDDAEGSFGSPSLSEEYSPAERQERHESHAPPEYQHPHEQAVLLSGASPTYPSPSHSVSPSHPFAQLPKHIDELVDPKLRTLICKVYLHQPLWEPFSDPIEAKLFRHFVHELAKWLDLCDPNRSFQKVFPREARRCTILMNAIFALAARHMLYTGHDLERSLETKYHSACYRELNPMLDIFEVTKDHNLFAAVIILRVYEEIGAKSGEDSKTHMLGIYHFVNMRSEKYWFNRGLEEASFWVGLRQEIYVAVVNKEPLSLPLTPSLIGKAGGFAEVEDHIRANRAVVHCAEVLNFYYCKTDVTLSQWVELRNRNQKWAESLPPSFNPIYRQSDEEAPFPHEWYEESWHVIGIQHHLLAELFLVRRNPNLDGVSLTHHIQALVRRICGVGLGNQWTPPGMFTACMAIAAFGDWFPDRVDQQAMLNILQQTEDAHARPTKAVQDCLRRQWGWHNGQETASNRHW